MKRLSSRPHGGPWVKTLEPLMWLGGAGHEQYGPGDVYFFESSRRTDRRHLVLQLTLSGAGVYERGGRRVSLPAGVAFLDWIPGNFRYGFPAEPAVPYEHVWVSFFGETADRWGERIVRTFGHVLPLGTPNAVGPLMLSIARRRPEGTRQNRYLESAQLYQLLMTVLSTLNESRMAATPLVRRAVALINERGNQPSAGVAQVAQELGVTREHLAREFREAMGVSPSDYLSQHRLRLAAAALRAGPDKLETIARAAGFTSANYLCRAFRKHAGITPAAFRSRPDWTLP